MGGAPSQPDADGEYGGNAYGEGRRRRQKPPPREPQAPAGPPVRLRKGQLVDIITAKSRPKYVPGKIVDVWDDGYQVRVTALEPDRSGTDFIYYDLSLERQDDLDCLAAFGAFTGMSEEAVAASGGFEAAVASLRSAEEAAARAPAPASAPVVDMSTREGRLEAARLAALGVGPGTGNKELDGDGDKGTAPPAAPVPALPDPGARPTQPSRNPLNRSAEDEVRDARDVIASRPEPESFVDVQCPDYCWRAARVVSVKPPPRGASPGALVLRCHVVAPTLATEGPSTAELDYTVRVEDMGVAPMGRYSDACIHPYSKGQIVDCRDDFLNRSGRMRRIWRPAEIRQVTNDHVLIHFLGWAVSWDSWLNMHCCADRLAEQGSKTNMESEEQSIARKQDAKFAAAMLEQGLRVVRVAKDGSCLFRSLAHQVYGDPSRHDMVRQEIVRHLREHAERFQLAAAAVGIDAAPAAPVQPTDAAAGAEARAGAAADTEAGEGPGAAAMTGADPAAGPGAGQAATAGGDAAGPGTDAAAADVTPLVSAGSAAAGPPLDPDTDPSPTAAEPGVAAPGATTAPGESTARPGTPPPQSVPAAEPATTPGGAAAASASTATPAAVSGEFEAYLTGIAEPTAWGGDPEVMAAEELFDREVVIFSGADYERAGHVAPMARMESTGGVIPPDREPIRLSYHGGRHYNSVEPTAGPSLAARGGLGRLHSGILAATRRKAFGQGHAVTLPLSPTAGPSPSAPPAAPRAASGGFEATDADAKAASAPMDL